jgi:predicted RNA-binding Zn-ribbon protein involved in translation (DUF1610 family)
MTAIEKFNWKCLSCGSICNSDLDTVPAPCDYCGSVNIVRYDDAPADSVPDVRHEGDA